MGGAPSPAKCEQVRARTLTEVCVCTCQGVRPLVEGAGSPSDDVMSPGQGLAAGCSCRPCFVECEPEPRTSGTMAQLAELECPESWQKTEGPTLTWSQL